jgi:TonB family protein
MFRAAVTERIQMNFTRDRFLVEATTMRMSPFVGLLFAGLFSGFLFATNPTKEDYANWAKEQVASESQNPAEKLMVAALGGMFVDATTTREDFIIFSIYKTDPGNNAKFTTLGILRHFVLLSVWSPGTTSPAYPHVIRAQAEGQWLPADGYAWINNPPVSGDMRVQWVPWRSASINPNVVSAPTEGRWLPADGYAWINNPPVPGDLRVRWIPGKRSIIHPHVFAAGIEGRWLPESGYTWVVNPPVNGDFRVKWIGVGQPLMASNCGANPYLCRLFGLIMRQRRYPNGDHVTDFKEVVIHFWLDEQGDLIRQQLYKPSGDIELDNEALAAIGRAAPFPPPPENSPHSFIAKMEFPPN